MLGSIPRSVGGRRDSFGIKPVPKHPELSKINAANKIFFMVEPFVLFFVSPRPLFGEVSVKIGSAF